MRQLLLSATLAAVLAAAGAAQDQQPRRFRGGVDLIAIDVSAVDSKGRPVDDLKPGDFTVKVDGVPRPVVSAQLIKIDGGGKPATRPRAGDALISTNDTPPNARRIIVAVDQTLITPGMITPLLRTAAEFVDRLAPSDYAAFLAFPEPGPRVEFTTDKTRVRDAMQKIVGQPGIMPTGEIDIAVWESMAITGPESIRNSTFDAAPGPVMAQVMARECRDGLQGQACKTLIYNESVRIASNARVTADISLRALEALLKDLVPLEGPKSMVLFSAGLVTEDPSKVDAVARLAAEARTSIHVIAVEHGTDRMLNRESPPPPTSSLQDRSYELAGLDWIADYTGGRRFNGIASGAGVFKELESTLSAWYLVAVQRRAGDAERQRLTVEIKRRGVTARSNKTAINVTPKTQGVDELLSDALSSPFAIPGLPLAVTTFTQRDPVDSKYRVRIAAQVGASGEPSGEFALGYMLTDLGGRLVTRAGSRRTLAPEASGPSRRLHYDTALAVAPGSYALRVAVVDKDGRRGSVVHRLELPKFEAVTLPTSDLIVGNLPADGELLSPRVEPQVTTSELAGYLELYLADAAREATTVTLEIAEGESSPALATGTLTLRAGESPSTSVATGFVPATMTPGRYVARATVRRDGAVVKTIARPFTLVRDPAVVSRTPPRIKGVAISPELSRRTAAYVASVVTGLGNIVGQEDFTLSGPNRTVQSDLWLVQYPGTQRGLIPFRDVTLVNGRMFEGRERRLMELFLNEPAESLRDLARRIMANADPHVPSAFNPIFVIGFLQSDYQWRFNLTVGDAGAEWRREVKAVSFVEVGRPTLLRTGPFGDLDAPTQGTAWIEEGTGRILQTELQIGRGRSAPKMITKFGLDERLQVMVPTEMRTQNPDGVATYSNFRRFEADADSAVHPPSPK